MGHMCTKKLVATYLKLKSNYVPYMFTRSIWQPYLPGAPISNPRPPGNHQAAFFRSCKECSNMYSENHKYPTSQRGESTITANTWCFLGLSMGWALLSVQTCINYPY